MITTHTSTGSSVIQIARLSFYQVFPTDREVVTANEMERMRLTLVDISLAL
jgi:hypothetical protein